jgi:hypothetical protein
LDKVLCGNYIDTCAVFRKKLWEACSGFDATMNGLQDWEMWIHAAALGWRFHKLNQVTFNYRVRPNSFITRLSQPDILKQYMGHIVHKHEQLYLENGKWMTYLHEMWPKYITYDRIVVESDVLTVNLKQAQQQLVLAQQQIALMQRSKGWRLSVAYWTLRDRLLQFLRFKKSS